jgi:flagellar motor switch protein FliG
VSVFSDDLRAKARDLQKLADEMDALDCLVAAWRRASPEARDRFVSGLSAHEIAQARAAE